MQLDSGTFGARPGPRLGLRRILSRCVRLAIGCLVIATMLLAVAGCGQSSPATTTTPTPSATATPSPSGQSASDQVLAAYRAEWAAFEQAAATSDVSYPGLAETMVDPLLHQIRLNLAGDKADGIVTRGTIDLHPQIASINGNTAMVTDCSYSKSVLVYAATGQLVPPITQPEYNGVKAMLVQVTPGVWKVQQQTVTEGKCS